MSAAFANLGRRVPVLLTLLSRMTHRPQPLTTCVGLLMLSLGPVAALQPGAAALRLRAAPAGLRTRVAMEAAPAQCALISLSGDDPLRVAQVLKKAWMEGGVKRGLKGSVLVGAPARSRAPRQRHARPAPCRWREGVPGGWWPVPESERPGQRLAARLARPSASPGHRALCKPWALPVAETG